MIDDLTLAERQIADIKAAEYQGKGYKVYRDAPLYFLPSYRADLLVEKDDQTTVIAVKTRPSLVANPSLRQFKRIINSRPGWTFELQLVGEPERVDATENAQPLDEVGILERISQAESLRESGLAEAGLLVAWTAAEGVLRMMVAAEGVAIERATDPAYIVSMAVAHGAIDRDTYHHLLRIMEYRNAIAHGFEVDDFRDAMVSELIDTVGSLLSDHREFEASNQATDSPLG